MLSSNIFCGLHKCTLPAFIRAVGLVICNDSIKCIDLLKETTISVLTTRPLGATADVFRCKSRDICHLHQTQVWIRHNMSANLHHRHGVQCQCVTPLSLSTLLVSKAHSNMISQKYSCKWTTLQLKGSATKLGFSKLLQFGWVQAQTLLGQVWKNILLWDQIIICDLFLCYKTYVS